ncbi:MAG: hypothetical protein M1827_000774 [Pycnora praestabilis]|nr:MAG: hypothetical protein M1827_000774 [Pycnora praestabilis]
MTGVLAQVVLPSKYFFDHQLIRSLLAVPNGGYVTSVFLRVAATHFRTTLSKEKQPHTIALHLDFLRRTQSGAAIFKVKDVKIGRQTSTIHITLVQGSREEVVGYITNSNMHTQDGPSFSTEFALHPPPSPAIVAKLKDGTDAHYAAQLTMPFEKFRKASQKVIFFLPRDGQKMRSLADEWLCFRNGERFTNESLGFVADMAPQIIEAYREKTEPRAVRRNKGEETQAEGQPKGQEVDKQWWAKYWYPTLLLNLDIKKALPEEGVEWLFVRARAKKIEKGRMDIEFVIMDEGGDLVALSHHVAFILSAERNMADRSKSGNDNSRL